MEKRATQRRVRLRRVELPTYIGFQVAAYLKTNPNSRWTDAIDALATRL